MLRHLTITLLFISFFQSINAQAPELIANLYPGTGNGLSEFHTSFLKIGNRTVLVADNGQTGLELFVLENNTLSLLKDIKPGTASAQPTNLTVLGDKVYFVATDSLYGRELWVTDGTPAGTVIAQDLVLGTGSGNPGNLIASTSGILFFERSHKLYSMIPGAAPVLINAPPYIDLIPDYSTGGQRIVAYKDGVALSAKLNMFGDSAYIYLSNGTPAGTRKVAAFLGSFTGGIEGIMALDDNVLFSVRHSFAPENAVNALYAVSGVPGEQPVKLLNAALSANSAVERFLPANGNTAYFYTVGGMYVTNGTDAGTAKLTSSLQSSLTQNEPYPFAFLQGKALFQAEASSFSNSIYKSDGTNGGTGILKTINENFVEQFFRYRDKIFFVSGVNNGFTPKIWESDLTAAGTKSLYNYPINSSISSIIILGFIDEYLYFQSNLGGDGRELYRVKLAVGVSTSIAPAAVLAYTLEQHPANSMYVIHADNQNENLIVDIFDLQGRTLGHHAVNAGEAFYVAPFGGMGVFVVHGRNGIQSFKVFQP